VLSSNFGNIKFLSESEDVGTPTIYEDKHKLLKDQDSAGP